ncbi:MAG: hypothetical protein NTY81_02725 [Candidatus Staskawiczbacteria bacterium]|nr:hypothetical protein [Candidatus Staskawiczbacteria bacterium]
MQKGTWLLAILGLIMVILIGILIFVPAKKSSQQNPPAVTETEGIQIIAPKLNEEISSPLKITGVVNGNGWGGFEGQVGTVKLLDNNGNQLGIAILIATTDWMQSVINFETTLNFQSDISQSGTLVFHNENPSGDPARDKTFSLPIKIK